MIEIDIALRQLLTYQIYLKNLKHSLKLI